MTAESTRFTPNESASALPAGTRLGEFEISGLLGIGGFGIVYLAFDHALEREVAIKEYMPAMMAGRTETMHVSLRSQSDAETFALGLRSFVNEAKLLARFDHPALLKVYRFWEANGTAYMAMPVLKGRTLKQIRATLTEPPDEAWLRGMLDPLLGAIEHLHNAGVYHRDIAPDNIQIEPDGHPVLVDFGAARRVITDKTQTLTAILKPAYAPIEQYAEVASVKQGPWTDLYALGATLHYMLLGRPPSPATTRAVHDDVQPLAQQALPGCRPEFLAAIDWMLNPRPVDRPQSVAALREVLDGMSALPFAATQAAGMAQATAQAAPAAWDRTLLAGRGNPAAGTGVQPTDIDLPMGSRVIPSPPSETAAQTAAGAAAVVTQAQADLPLEPAPVDPDATLLMPRAAPASPARQDAPAAVAAPVAAKPRSWMPWAGTGLGLLAVLAWAIWLRPSVEPAPAAPAVAASSAAISASSPPEAAAGPASAAPLPPPMTAAASSPAARAPTARMPMLSDAKPAPPGAATGTPARTPTATPDAPAGAPPAARTPAAPAAAASPAPAPPVVAGAAAAPPATVAATPPTAAAAVPATAAPHSPSPPEAARPAAATEAGKAAAAIGPEAKCEGRNPVMYFVCMERECLRGGNQSHPDCAKWRQSKPPEQR
jgi:hypothetical protein